MRSAAKLTIWSCLPRIMCGPFCSMPPLGTITRVWPCAMALRTSTQVMSVILSVFGSGAVSGLVTIVSANVAEATATRASFNKAYRRGGVAAGLASDGLASDGLASDMGGSPAGPSRRSAIVGGDAFEGVNPRPALPLPRRRCAELRAPLRRHGGTWHFLAAQIDLVDAAGVADLLQRVGGGHDAIGV